MEYSKGTIIKILKDKIEGNRIQFKNYKERFESDEDIFCEIQCREYDCEAYTLRVIGTNELVMLYPHRFVPSILTVQKTGHPLTNIFKNKN